MNGCDILIKVLLNAKGFRVDIFQVFLERFQHLDPSFESIHAPIVLNCDGSPSLLEAMQDC